MDKPNTGGWPTPSQKYAHKLGERTTSDVIVRLKTGDGRDDSFYSHTEVLSENSKYFASRLSPGWPTYHLLDSRNYIELPCLETDIDYYVMLLRLFYAKDERLVDIWYNVKNALGILKVATKLGCDNIVSKCTQYLEAVPWEENEEEEILKTLPSLGLSMIPVLARIQPVDSEAVRNVFISAIRVATMPERKSCELLENFPSDLKAAAQEQVEYMLIEDDDAPLLVADDIVQAELRKSFSELFEGFKVELAALQEANSSLSEEFLLEKVSDLSWATRVLPKVELLKELVLCWVEASDDVLRVLSDARLHDVFWETKFKVVDVTSKVLEAVGYGTVIIPADQRTQLVKCWLPYIRCIKPIFEANFISGKMTQRLDGELTQNIELALVSLILSLPSSDQAEILADWLKTDHARFPDLTEAFEVWCFRSKSAKRRFSVEVSSTVTTPPITAKGCGV